MFHRAASPDIDQIGVNRAVDTRRLLEAIRRHLPILAHPRGRLREFLSREAQLRGSESRCKVTNVFDAGERLGLMCQLEAGDSGDPSLLVTPITDLSPLAILGLAAAFLVARLVSAPAPIDYLTENSAPLDLETSVLATGVLQAVRQVDVGTRVTGQLKSLKVQLGDHVEAGDLLAVIDPVLPENDLRSQQANLARLEADRRSGVARQKRSKLELARQKGMVKGDATSRRDLESADQQSIADEEAIASLDAQIVQARVQIETAAANLAYTKITAPIDGDVVAILTREGQTVVASQTVPVILKLADLGAMTVKTQISEGDVTRVRVGQSVSFSIMSEPDRSFSGVLRAVEPAPQSFSESASAAAASSSSTSGPSNAVFYNALFDIANPDRLRRVGMTAQVKISLGDARKVLAIPVGALREKSVDGRYLVRVLTRAGRVEARSVLTGVNNHILVEVLDGLTEGESVIVGEQPASSRGSS